MKQMLLNTLLVASIAFVIACNATAQNPGTLQNEEEISIIPLPTNLQQKNGSFKINIETKILVQQGNAEALHIAKMLAEKLQNAAGLNIVVSEANDISSNNTIYFTTAGANDS